MIDKRQIERAFDWISDGNDWETTLASAAYLLAVIVDVKKVERRELTVASNTISPYKITIEKIGVNDQK